jgi:hypothetical protein
VSTDDRQRLSELNLALESALEQLTHAHRLALGATPPASEPDPPAAVPAWPELAAIERLLGELTAVRNQVRERLMRVLARPSLNIVK